MTIVAVGVPLRDESAGLPALLASLLHQRPGGWDELRIHLLFDGVGDDGVTVARQALVAARDIERVSLALHLVERQARPNAGAARRQAIAFALADRRAPPDMLLTTDGDTVPAPDWVARAAAALHEVDLVAGHIARDDSLDLPSRDALEGYLEALHALRRAVDPIAYDPAPSHPWVGGANLGFRTASYRTLGGFEPLACDEDSAIVERARHLGLLVRQARDVRVTTSARLVGRIAGGLSDALAHMARERTEPVVEHPADAASQYARHALARRLRDGGGGDGEWRLLARAVGGDVAGLAGLAGSVPNGEAFAMKAVPARPTERTLPLGEAARALADLEPAAFRLG